MMRGAWQGDADGIARRFSMGERVDLPQMMSIVLVVTPDRRCHVRGNVMRTMHGSFIASVAAVDPALATQLDAPGSNRKPFTASLLRRGEYVRGQDTVSPGDMCTWRLTGLTSAVCDAIRKLVIAGKLEIDHQPFTIARVAKGPGYDHLMGQATYAELLRNSDAHRRITLAFESATAYKAQEVLSPFPLPDSVFGGYLDAWQQFGGEDLRPDMRTFRTLVIDSFQLRTEQLYMDAAAARGDRSRAFIGFVGTITYDLERISGDHDVRVLNLLSDFSLYCGTGSRTTRGAGQTRRLR